MVWCGSDGQGKPVADALVPNVQVSQTVCSLVMCFDFYTMLAVPQDGSHR